MVAESPVWRVRVDSLVLEPYQDEAMPYRGIVQSSWFLNGRRIGNTATTSQLPIWILDEGLSQDCWAFWVEETNRWDW